MTGAEPNYSPERLDALREVANIGAGHAATALSTLTNGRIMISVPTIRFVIPDDNARRACFPGENIAAVMMDISGSIQGRTALILPADGSLRLAERMLGRERGTVTKIGELEQSAVSEAGNIIGGAYLTALSEFLGMRLLPSPPTLVEGETGKALGQIFPDDGGLKPVLCVETEFEMKEPAENLRGYFILVPDETSFEAIFSAVRVA
ncbi:MAG: chemotaxis protein CheC [Gemmatimonadaceae bacterium]|nr:chemotaxis protein CheC [Gemmatimonadaceae bacterium]